MKTRHSKALFAYFVRIRFVRIRISPIFANYFLNPSKI
jgi:hypothetical protein